MSDAAITTESHPGGHPPGLKEQFEDLDQQHDADALGMWVFLATEMLFFGGLFAAYILYRSLHYSGFVAGSRLLERNFGALMTFILLGSSFTMAMGVHAARTNQRKLLALFLILTILLGAGFLGIKFTEYHQKWEEGLVPGLNFHPTPEQLQGAPWESVAMFMCFYFFMTGLHALHMIIGIGLLTVMTILFWRRENTAEQYMRIEVSGLYWHFVDVIWIFLFPLLYLIGGPR